MVWEGSLYDYYKDTNFYGFDFLAVDALINSTDE
jgi:hypothetical protein